MLLIIAASMSIGCKPSDSSAGEYAYIGGEIINPKNKTIIIYNTKGKVVDSVSLDSNNRFIHKINDLVPGLYSLTHGVSTK
jgi:hypothetical protein